MTTAEQILRASLWLVIPLALVASVAMHELAHATAAVLLRGRAYAIELGRGAPWAHFRLGGISWTLRGVPFSGLTLFTLDGSRAFRLRTWLVIAAGPLSNAAVAAAAIWILSIVDGESRYGSFAAGVGRMVLSYQLVLLLFALLPRRSRTAHGPMESDGSKLLSVPRMKPEDVRAASEAHRSLHHVLEAREAYARHDYDRARAEAARIGSDGPMQPLAEYMRLITMPPGDLQAVCDGLEALFASLAEQHPFRTDVANSLAWFLLMTERRDVLVRAESLSRYAVARTPKESHCQGTLGSILVEQGRTGEGRPLLEAALRGNARAGKALNACYLARAELQDGEIDRARAFLDRARRLDPKCGLLARTEERLAAASGAQPQA